MQQANRIVKNILLKCKPYRVITLLLFLPSQVLADLAIIANKEFTSDLSQRDIKMLYLGKAQHLDDKSVLALQPVNLPYSNAQRLQFDKSVLGKTEANLRTYWARMIFTSRSRPPRELTTSADVIQHVLEKPNTIGYIDAQQLTENVRVLFIIKQD